MSKAFKVKFYSDPGHGWAAVKRKVLDDLEIANKISAYSYQKGNTVYLEEDCDFSVLADALKAKKMVISIEHKTTEYKSPIRNYQRFTV